LEVLEGGEDAFVRPRAVVGFGDEGDALAAWAGIHAGDAAGPAGNPLRRVARAIGLPGSTVALY